MLRHLRRFRRNKSGLAAVEFALIAPFMIALFFGLVEICNALNARQKVSAVASTAADLTGQASSLTAANLDDIFAASSAIMTPFSVGDISIVITSIGGTGERNVGKVLWSMTNGRGTAHAVGSTVTVGDPDSLSPDDTGLLPATCTSEAQCSLIMAEVKFDYTSPYGEVIIGTVPMKDSFFTKPRRVVAVPCSDCSG